MLFKILSFQLLSEKFKMYQVGQHTLAIPMSMFKENREKVVNALKASGKISVPSDTYILLQGGDDLSLYDTDVNYLFRQVKL